MAKRQAIRCSKTRSTDGKPCRKWAIVGTDPMNPVCASHSGRAPQVRAKADARQADAKMAKAIEKLGITPREATAGGALHEELAFSQGLVDRIKDDWAEKGGDLVRDGAATPHVRLLADERRHLVDVSRAIATTGADERRGELLAAQAAAVARLTRSTIAIVLEVAGVTATAKQSETINQLVASEMRSISRGAAPIEAHASTALPPAALEGVTR
jgi:hypothetical protein